MELVLEQPKEATRIKAGDVVVVTTESTGVTRSYLAVRHDKVDEGRITLVSLSGIGLRGSHRNTSEAIEAWLKDNGYKYVVYPQQKYVLKLEGQA